jgi:hypothetical protein
MAFALELGNDHTSRQLRALEIRYRRMLTSLTAARASYASLQEIEGSDVALLAQAQRRIQHCQQQLADLQTAIETVEDRL